jgi:hypothetical protein
MALLAMKTMVTTETPACSIISSLARLVSGRVSVGLKARLVLKARNR